jgi:hypothetical protein
MPKKTLRITAHTPAIPKWLKINNTVTIPLSLKTARELAAKLLEVKEDVELELNFSTGKEPLVEIKYETREKEETKPDKPETGNSNS